MNTKIYALIIASVLIFSGCNQTQKTVDEQAGKNESTVKNETIDPLNPNLASADELKKYLDSDLVEVVVMARPFISLSEYIDLLSTKLSDQELKEVCQYVFLPINLNTADKREMLLVPGVGEKMAHEFDEYRPYRSIAQFRREIGKYVSEEQVATYEKYVFVPVDLNNASKEEILSIPGVGKKMLHEFEEYRPYTSIEQFRREIGKYVDENELKRLERYVTL